MLNVMTTIMKTGLSVTPNKNNCRPNFKNWLIFINTTLTRKKLLSCRFWTYGQTTNATGQWKGSVGARGRLWFTVNLWCIGDMCRGTIGWRHQTHQGGRDATTAARDCHRSHANYDQMSRLVVLLMSCTCSLIRPSCYCFSFVTCYFTITKYITMRENLHEFSQVRNLRTKSRTGTDIKMKLYLVCKIPRD